MGLYKGSSRNPNTGRVVNWKLAPVLVPLGQQLDKLGITWYSIGDANHLRKKGGHTPWKPGTDGKTVTAIDVMKSGYPDVERRILGLMRLAAYDTTWIDFINTNYRQYDFDGRFQDGSGDGHLHLEVLPNKVNAKAPNLFYDMFGWPAGVTKPKVTPTVPKTTPVSNATVRWEDKNMFKTVKLRSADEVYLVLHNGSLQHLSPAQFKAVQAANLKALPTGADAKDKAKVTEPFVVEDEEALAAFGTKIIAQTTEVEGL